ncbi:IclR family transcriptional regulator [Phreatobacter aquaticus]|uniref:IclR family transcriptional regulator n=1 Tax=Phreatobacter aquaticus TaxID=2570229 RepID=A0A4D7QM55_9HYPH|nr:IclR family transcriptional regulator [Phreatobacter aquaticus]QCK87601.1 IclR family transcriptional regulator [Phreatobacter aquaticus]
MGTRSTDNESQMAGDGLVRSVDRAMMLISLLGAAGSGASLAELATRAGLSVSTTHRLLSTLESRGFVRFDRRLGRWSVGRATFAAGSNFAGSRDLVGLAQPIMKRLGGRLGETVNLGMIDDGHVTFLYRFDARQARAYVPPAGAPVPVHGSSIGKVLLAALPGREVEDLLAAKLHRLTPHTIIDPRALRDTFGGVQRDGYAVDDQENTLGLRCLAAPVLDEYGRPVAALSLAAPIERLQKQQLAEFGRMVAGAADELTGLWRGVPV